MEIAIDDETRIVYNEVNDILDLMGEEYKNKIPPQIRKALKENEIVGYQTNIQKALPFSKQRISKKALAILAMFNLFYWIEDISEKERLKQIYLKNNAYFEEKERSKIEKLFPKQNKTKQSNCQKEDDIINNEAMSKSQETIFENMIEQSQKELKRNLEQSSKATEQKMLIPIKGNIINKIKSFILKLLKKK